METQSAGGNGATRKAEPASTTLAGAWQPSTVDVEARTVEVIFSTGEDVERQDYFTGERYVERLRIDSESVDLRRLNAGAPVLDSHNRFSVHDQLGRVVSAWIEGGKAHARLLFSEREAADAVFRDIAAGVLANISVGYRSTATRELEEQIDGIQVRETYRWEPLEISIVSVPADAGAQVRNADQLTLFREAKGNTPMTTEIQTPAAVPTPHQAAIAERERVQWIDKSCRTHNLPDELRNDLIDNGTDLEQCKDRVLEALIAAPGHEEIDGRFAPGDGGRQRDFASTAGDAILHRERIVDTDNAQALALTSRSMVEIARMCCEQDGVGLPRNASRIEIATRALDSATLTDVIAHTAGRSLALGYQAEPRVFAEIFRESSAQNFRPLERVKLSDLPTLPLVAENTDYTEAAFGDTKETYTLASYGSIVAFTRQLLINDDVDAISRVPQMLGAAAAARENDTFWGVLNTNGAMVDTRDIFNVADGNLVVGALDAANLEAARLWMQSQTTENGVSVGLQPAWLVVGPDLLTAAEKLVRPPVDYATSTLAATLSTALANQLQLRVEPRVATGEWFVFSDYRRFDTCEFSYLAGQRGVYLERDVRFESGEVRLKATLDFGAAAIDRRGLYQVTAT